MLQSEIQPDTLHLSDWPLTDESYFAHIPLRVNCANYFQARAHAFALDLYRKFANVRAIYLRGSVIESIRPEFVKDVDILAVMDQRMPDCRSHIREYTSTAWGKGQGHPRCDLSFIDLDRVKQEPFTSAIQLVVAFRACLLAGEPVWTTTPFVRPDMFLAIRCQENHCRLVNLLLEKALTAPREYEPQVLVAWMQKKSLRLGGILAMGASARFSRHPLRCSVLVSETYPELELLAAQVVRDYVDGRSDARAWRVARRLFDSLVARGHGVEPSLTSDKPSSPAQTKPIKRTIPRNGEPKK